MKYKNILIVDDSSTSRMIIRRCFEIAGYAQAAYFEAENGLDALNVVGGHEIDLIVTDLNMPKMDGINFMKKLRLDGVRQPDLVVISGLADSLSQDERQAMDIKAVIRKPISPTKILEEIGS